MAEQATLCTASKLAALGVPRGHFAMVVVDEADAISASDEYPALRDQVLRRASLSIRTHTLVGASLTDPVAALVRRACPPCHMPTRAQVRLVEVGHDVYVADLDVGAHVLRVEGWCV